MRNSFLKNETFGERLYRLIESKNIKNAQALAQAMYDSGILEYKDPDSKTSMKEAVAQSARSINNHLHYESAESLSGKWINAYCDFFGCSADYIFGKIEKFTHETTDICSATGLSEASVNTLLTFGQTGSDPEPSSIGDLMKPAYSHTLSRLLEDPLSPALFLQLSIIRDMAVNNPGDSISDNELFEFSCSLHDPRVSLIRKEDAIRDRLWETDQIFIALARRISGLPDASGGNSFT